MFLLDCIRKKKWRYKIENLFNLLLSMEKLNNPFKLKKQTD